MTLLAFVLAIVASFYAGYRYERLLASLKSLRSLIESKQDKKETNFTSNTSHAVIDPFDAVQVAKFEHDIQMKILNPEAKDE